MWGKFKHLQKNKQPETSRDGVRDVGGQTVGFNLARQHVNNLAVLVKQ